MASKKGWAGVGKSRGGGGGDDTYLRLEDGGKAVFRMLDEEPVTIRQHKLGQEKDGENLFLSLTCGGDNCYICDRAQKRFPPGDTWAANVLVLSGLADQKEHEVRVLVGGPMIWKQMAELYEEYGDIREFDILITRDGKDRDTTYNVTASPKSQKINVANEVRNRDLHDIEALFAVKTPDEQKAALEEAGFDIDYDPVFERMQTMTLEEAMKVEITFGKKKGKTIREVFIEDPSYLRWMAQNVTSSVDVGAAARLAVEGGMKKEKAGQKAAPGSKIQTTGSKKKVEEEPAKPATNTLVDRLRAYFNDTEPYSSDPSQVAELIKKYGKGKRRLHDLADADLKALAKHVKVK